MPVDLDDFFGPKDDEDFDKPDVIDVTPKEEEKKEGIDFDSDKPIIEQMLENHELDRTDQRPTGYLGQIILIIFASMLIVFILAFVFGR